MSIKKHIPNILSTIRLGMALSLPFVFFNTTLLNTLLFYLAGDATDAVDGFLARKWKVQSRYGQVIDPIADKMLNGLTLLLTSIVVNPLLFILTGFEALIAGTNLLRIKNKKDIHAAQIGKVKTVFLFFATVSALLVPMVPALSVTSNILIGLTATLQALTAGKYLSDYHKENKEAQAKKKDIIENEEPIESDEIKKLEHAKELLHTLAGKTGIAVSPISYNEIDQQPVYETNELNGTDGLGISRTFKK